MENPADDVFDRTVYIKPELKERPLNEIDYSSQNGPKLKYLWCRSNDNDPNDENSSLLAGQTLFLGGDVGSDGKIYFIPGHAPRVLQLDPATDELRQIGPTGNGKYKWLRSVTVGDVIYGIPCHSDSVLRIHTSTATVTLMNIPYEEFYAGDPKTAAEQRNQKWKYHGGNLSPLDKCIYAIPQSATHVLKIDPVTDVCSLIGPSLPGRWKWYGGLIGKPDGAIYGIPQNSAHVLRIHPNDGVTLHGNFGDGGHKWHGASTTPDGTIVCVPSNADSVLCIKPPNVSDSQNQLKEPTLYLLGDETVIRTGRHRKDRKYKFLGAMTGSDGRVYIFPSGSEYVLQVDPLKKMVQNVGPNIYDQQMEEMCQNKWQNGVLSHFDKSIYAIPLSSNSLLQIDTSRSNPKISTWPLPAPCRSLAKFEGAVVAPNGVIYTVPNNFKAVMRIQPYGCNVDAARTDEHQEARETAIYRSGIATLRSSAHRVKYAPKNRKHDPQPRNREGELTGTPWLPPEICMEDVFSYDGNAFDMVGAVRSLLLRCDPTMVGSFRELDEESLKIQGNFPNLEDFVVPVPSTWRCVNGGQCETAQKYLSNQVAEDEEFLAVFDRLVREVVLPRFKQRLVSVGALPDEPLSATFYYQRPPTLRLQPGPALATIKPHFDGEYGHQNGELNFWLPLTDSSKTRVDLWCESKYNVGDYHRIPANLNEIISFHGSSCRHYVNANSTPNTRVSLDFRVGVQGFFDPTWQMRGTTDDHGRKEVTL